MTQTYIAVPFDENAYAKSHGAKFDWTKKLWYTDNLMLIEKYKINNITTLVGEDRTYGGNKLRVDLIPRTCWFTNVRYCISPSDWIGLRKYIVERVDNMCECCNFRTSSIEAHERWSYNNNIQKLERIVALCHDCHQSTHIGFADINGNGEEARKHLKQVLSLDDDECVIHVDNAYEIWRERSDTDWNLDLSLMTNNNITLIKPVANDERRAISKNTLREQSISKLN